MAVQNNEEDNDDADFVNINGRKLAKRSMWSKNAEFLNGVTLSLEASFGYYQNAVRKNVYFVSDDTLIYMCGKHIVEYDIMRKKQSYIMKDLDDEAIAAMNFYLNKKKSLSVAVALRSTTRVLPQVKIYNRSKNFCYYLVHSHLSPTSNILDVTFFKKSKYLLSLSESSRKHQIAVWYVQKERLLTYIEVDDEISKINLSSISPEEFSMSGKSYFKIWHFNENEKTLSVRSINLLKDIPEKLIDHCWISHSAYLIVVNSANQILVFKNNALVKTLKIDLTSKDIGNLITTRSKVDDRRGIKESVVKIQAEDHQIFISCITPTARGFAVGLSGIGIICLYEIDKSEEILHKGNFRLKEDHVSRIHSLQNSPDDMYLAVSAVFQHKSAINKNDGESTAEGEQDVPKDSGRVEIFIFNIAVVDAFRTTYKDPFEPIFEKGVHKGKILNLAVSPTRSILLSLSSDKTCKLWEYGQEFKETFSHYFHETPLCLSLHPLSIQCAVGFKEGIRFFYVLDDDLRPVYQENSKACHAVAYSDGGNMLAAANENIVNLYNTYTFEIVHSLSGHGGIIQEISWIDNDGTIQTSDIHGLHVWNVYSTNPNNKLVEHYVGHNKGVKYNTVTYDRTYDLVVCCCNDSKLRLYSEKGCTLVYEYDLTPYQFTAVHINSKLNVIFLGTNVGSVRVYLWPFYDYTLTTLEFIEFPIHQSPISSLRVSYDFTYLISGSEGGSIFLSKIREYLEGHDVSSIDMISALGKGKNKDIMGKFANVYSLNLLCLTSNTSVEEKKSLEKELKYRINNLTADIDEEKEKNASDNKQRVKTMEEKNRDALSKQKESLAITMEEADKMHRKLVSEIEDQRRKHAELKENLENENSERLLECYQIQKELQTKIEELKAKFETEKETVRTEYSDILRKVEGEYQAKYQELYERFSQAVNNMKMDQNRFTEVMKQSEDEYDQFLEKTKENLNKTLEAETDRINKLRQENSKLQKDNDRYKDRINHLETIIADTRAQIKHMEEEERNFSDKNSMMKKQLKDKETIINIKENQIKEYRSKNLHLQNFRSVYDYRVNMLKEERVPLLDHLDNMDKHVKMMYKELLDEASSNKKLDNKLKDSGDKISDLKSNLRDKNEILSITKRKIENFEYQIMDMLKSVKYEHWLKRLNDVYQENFEGKGRIDRVIREGSTIGSSLRELQKDQLLETLEKNAQEAIQEELIRQRDFMSKKLNSLTQVNKRVESDRDEIFIRIQNENTNLIRECNLKRKEKQNLKNTLSTLQKTLKEVTREITSLTADTTEIMKDDDMDEILTNEKTKNSEKRVSAPRELPFVKYIQDKQTSKRKKSAGSPGLKGPNNNKLFDVLLNEIGKYNEETSDQGILIEKLREKVHTFLYNEESQNNTSLPPLNKERGSLAYNSTLPLDDVQNSNILIANETANMSGMKKIQSEKKMPNFKTKGIKVKTQGSQILPRMNVKDDTDKQGV